MREATVSLLGMHNYDPTVLDLLVIPEELDRSNLINNLLAETAELEILYSNPTVLKNLIGVWSLKELPVWQKLYNTTVLEYNPIENYDRHEEETTRGTGSRTHSGTDRHTDTLTEGGTQGDSNTYTMRQGGTDTVTGTRDTLHKVAGFDTPDGSSTMVEQSQDTETASTTTNYGRTETGSGSNTTTFGKTESRTGSIEHGEAISDQNSGTRTLYVHGNIGVMSSQDMIKQEREVDEFNIVDYIIRSFMQRFCILVY